MKSVPFASLADRGRRAMKGQRGRHEKGAIRPLSFVPGGVSPVGGKSAGGDASPGLGAS